MVTRASSTFTLDSWDEEPYDEREGARLIRTRITKTFLGDLKATSVAETLMAHGQVAGSAAYVGFERIVGRLHNRAGSFVLQHSASGSGGVRSGSWTVVPDTATGELTGLRGQAEIIVEETGEHRFVLDYEITPL